MHRASLVPAILTAIMLFSMTQAAFGQQDRFSRGRVNRPTLSPYLDYFRSDSGPLPAYQQFVRPRVQQRDFNQQGRQAVQQLQQRLQQVQTDAAPPTGVASRFRNSAGYFRNNQQYFRTHQPRR